ncbi:expressed unknown protein [Seminavis robusta]|uniref:DUF6824 domain-containing protein n=1 Tax=Seminavis robusta TaxID=568900 RepID=A0A9N8D4L3_9STRA|nr:expressed unknown protein [Seminavis robusta]|eukprot:Sro3_g002420.1 n/a (305) ;mRNA; f:146903-147984
MMDEILGRSVAETPADTDVLFGRGGKTNKHPGNQQYLELVAEHEVQYMSCTKRKFQKLMSLCIIHYLRMQGARFMEKDTKSGKWKTVLLSRCREKVSQRLRERIPFIKLEQQKKAAETSKAWRMSVDAVEPLSTMTYPNDVHIPPVNFVEVTDASSEDECESLLDSADLDDMSLFSLPPSDGTERSEDADTISLMSKIFLDDSFSTSCLFETAEEDQAVSEQELDTEDERPRKRQKRHDEDYDDCSYGTVVECVHDKDSLLTGEFSDVYSDDGISNGTGTPSSCGDQGDFALEDHAALVEYFLL